ncbi:ABC transporter [Desulfuribacillus stibiiarsenatis]|uniref:ABC-type quaternary amine transporter n=1 Tax=Desulfuribacillus stibiiarsenatis TaxID=1390249 RepID=A0A1E5L763_9FIRM|nr:ABC transporter ATP-binding protein [Desulfuribacillus stibiiarsenatis]OEH85987.1 ABC transporter [Desulfuribacillus stibiiarsenatis]
MHITVKKLCKSFGNFQASNCVSFNIEKGKLIGLLGPSGGGKTTILRMIAGLEEPDSGEILFNGECVNDKPPQERGIGFVFQNYALFRHMNVFQNISFGLVVQKKSKKEIEKRVNELICLTGLQGLEKRYPNQLSGGQRQRVAFARALAPRPQLLLLDEPFAAIDAKVRKELRTWLKDMIEKLGVTSIFVTHDQEEAIEVADEIIIINQGQVEQMGTPMEIYKQPKTAFVARFIGESNVIENYHLLRGFEKILQYGKAIIRPEFIEIGKEDEISNIAAAQRGIVRHVVYKGNSWQIEVEVGSHLLVAYHALDKKELRVSDKVWVMIHQMHVFDDQESIIVENRLKRAASQFSIPVYI